VSVKTELEKVDFITCGWIKIVSAKEEFEPDIHKPLIITGSSNCDDYL
jgi:hypothetical protein